MVLHPPDRCVDTRGGLRPPPFPCQLCWDIFTCTRLNERKTDTYRATSVHSCCLQAVRTPQNTPLEEKHQLSAERDIVNQAPSSQWCSQTCINVRTGAGQGRGTWTRYTCTCIWSAAMNTEITFTAMNNNSIWLQICEANTIIQWHVHTHGHISKQLFIKMESYLRLSTLPIIAVL